MRGRIGAPLLGLLFLLQGACFLNHPGIGAGEVLWGPVKKVLFTSVFAVARPSPEALRFPMLIAAALTVILTCLLLRRMAGPAALAGGVLLAADSTFLITSRVDSENVVLPRLFLVAGCWLMLRFWQGASRISLALGFLCWGLGCACRPELACVVVAISAAAGLAFGAEIAAAWGWRNWAPAGAGLLLGLAPLLAGLPPRLPLDPELIAPEHALSILDGSGWFNYTVRNLPGTWGVGAKGLTEQLCVAIGHASGEPRHNLTAIAVIAALVLAALVSILPSWTHRRALRFSVAATLGAAIFLPRGSYLLLWPVVYLAPGVLLASAARRSLFGAVGVAVVTSAVALSGLAVNSTYYAHAVLYGGTRAFTEAIYNLAADFELRDARGVRILAPSIQDPLRFLSGGGLPLVTESLAQNTAEDTLYISGTGGDSGSAILYTALSGNKRVRLSRVIQDYQGRSMFVLFRLE